MLYISKYDWYTSENFVSSNEQKMLAIDNIYLSLLKWKDGFR